VARPLGQVATILKDALDLLTGPSSECCISPAPCRTALYLGGEVPWDECGSGCGNGKSGMLWAKLISVDPQGPAQGGNCDTWQWTAEFGIVRCIATVSNNGNPPSATAIQVDADQQIADADAIFTALNCCASRPETLQDVTVLRWQPLGPTGACAGGTWTVKGTLNVCC
jgi:hypothetical protein